MTFVVPYNPSNEVFEEWNPWKELEQEEHNSKTMKKLLKDNQEYLKDLTATQRELRYLKKTMNLMQSEINRLQKEQS